VGQATARGTAGVLGDVPTCRMGRYVCRRAVRAGGDVSVWGVFAHIVAFNGHRRLVALDALRQLGMQTEGFSDPMEYEESVAPWTQLVEHR
jgi:hypothetical protein